MNDYVILDDIRWYAHVEPIRKGEEDLLKLSWGWTAGMTPEQIARLTDDDPKGHVELFIQKDQALQLIADLAAALGATAP
jgi:hypothetical protein